MTAPHPTQPANWWLRLRASWARFTGQRGTEAPTAPLATSTTSEPAPVSPVDPKPGAKEEPETKAAASRAARGAPAPPPTAIAGGRTTAAPPETLASRAPAPSLTGAHMRDGREGPARAPEPVPATRQVAGRLRADIPSPTGIGPAAGATPRSSEPGTAPTPSPGMAAAMAPAGSVADLRDPALYINRELSWMAFNCRVLEEALDEQNPLLERVKFVAIHGSNLDEFYMTRVAGLREQLAQGTVAEAGRDGLTPREQLDLIHQEVAAQVATKLRCLRDALIPALADRGIRLLDYADLDPAGRAQLRVYFEQEAFPVLTPLAVDAGRPFPHISNLSLNLLVVVRDEIGERYARVKVPPILPRLIPVTLPVGVPPTTLGEPDEAATGTAGSQPPTPVVAFVWLEQVIAAHVGALFPGHRVVGAYHFRVTRNADLAIREAEAEDLLESIEESLERRLFGFVVRLDVHPAMPLAMRDWLTRELELDPAEVHVFDGPLGLSDLMSLTQLDRPELKDPPFVPSIPADWPRDGGDVLDLIGRRDILLHHPYDSFSPVIDFVRAATGPHVLAIKQTLYRVGAHSPIVDALLEARDEETQVAVLVELKARFDEESNIGWARALEQAGVHVVYGLLGLKTHCKMTLIVRREGAALRRYVHLGTGNYNATSARTYTDMGLFTADSDIVADVSDLFNFLTGYSAQQSFRKLLVAPANLRARVLELIERETTHGARGRIIVKVNALVDSEVVESLYRASRAGVQIDLIVRGACSLRPGVPGVSETIRVRSVVGRFLEHSRIFYFGNGGDDELFLGSADLMPRNLNRRVEVLFPLESAPLKAQVRDDVLHLLLRDNVKARILQPGGDYIRARPGPGEPEINAQDALLGAATAVARP